MVFELFDASFPRANRKHVEMICKKEPSGGPFERTFMNKAKPSFAKILLARGVEFCIVGSPEQLLNSRKDNENGTQS
jgi:hypothetical protein